MTAFLIIVTVRTMERGARAPTQKVTPARTGRGGRRGHEEEQTREYIVQSPLIIPK